MSTARLGFISLYLLACGSVAYAQDPTLPPLSAAEIEWNLILENAITLGADPNKIESSISTYRRQYPSSKMDFRSESARLRSLATQASERGLQLWMLAKQLTFIGDVEMPVVESFDGGSIQSKQSRHMVLPWAVDPTQAQQREVEQFRALYRAGRLKFDPLWIREQISYEGFYRFFDTDGRITIDAIHQGKIDNDSFRMVQGYKNLGVPPVVLEEMFRVMLTAIQNHVEQYVRTHENRSRRLSVTFAVNALMGLPLTEGEPATIPSSDVVANQILSALEGPNPRLTYYLRTLVLTEFIKQAATSGEERLGQAAAMLIKRQIQTSAYPALWKNRLYTLMRGFEDDPRFAALEDSSFAENHHNFITELEAISDLSFEVASETPCDEMLNKPEKIGLFQRIKNYLK